MRIRSVWGDAHPIGFILQELTFQWIYRIILVVSYGSRLKIRCFPANKRETVKSGVTPPIRVRL